ncbi:hypothetical protein CCYA_CCYA05G1538 [Cyanidiococcus yangmingshanensis]|nr:hypothetical protein CCYA_CCYA05G1538 [Cyanidiococcus yangmingshanensis]
MGKKKTGKSNKVTVSLSEFVGGVDQSGPVGAVLSDPELAALPTAPRGRDPDTERLGGGRYGPSFGGGANRWERSGAPGPALRTGFGDAPRDWADDDDGFGSGGGQVEPELDWGAARRGLAPPSAALGSSSQSWARSGERPRMMFESQRSHAFGDADVAAATEPEPDFMRRGLLPPAAASAERSDDDPDRFSRRQVANRREMFASLPETSTGEVELDFGRRGLTPPAATLRSHQAPTETAVDFGKRGLPPPAAGVRDSSTDSLEQRSWRNEDSSGDFGQRGRLPPIMTERQTLGRSRRFVSTDTTAETTPIETDFGRRGVLPPAATTTTARPTVGERKPFSEHSAGQQQQEPVSVDFGRRGMLPPAASRSHSATSDSPMRKKPFSAQSTASNEISASDFGRRGVRPPAAAAEADAEAATVKRPHPKSVTEQGSKMFTGKETNLDWSKVRRGAGLSSKPEDVQGASTDVLEDSAATGSLSTTSNS